MTYTNFIKGISFRFIKPHTWFFPIGFFPIGFGRFIPWLKFGTSVEMTNTRLPAHEQKLKLVLRDICSIPKMSTFAIGALVNEGVSQMPEETMFVNVGVWHGFTFLSGIIKNEQKIGIGIDNFSQFGGPRQEFLDRFNTYKSPRHAFYEMDYKEYFSHVHQGKIGFYIYDANHSYKDQVQGLKIAEPFFANKSIILVDDTNQDQVRTALEDFIAGSACNYNILLDQTTFCNHHPTFWNGITVLQKVN